MTVIRSNAIPTSSEVNSLLPSEFTERIHIKGLGKPTQSDTEGILMVQVVSMDDLTGYTNVMDSSPAKFDFVVYRGVDARLIFTINTKHDGSSIDLTRFTFEGRAFMINNKNKEFLLEPFVNDDGKLQVTLSAEETAAIELEDESCHDTLYSYYINFISKYGKHAVYRVLMGTIHVCK